MTKTAEERRKEKPASRYGRPRKKAPCEEMAKPTEKQQSRIYSATLRASGGKGSGLLRPGQAIDRGQKSKKGSTCRLMGIAPIWETRSDTGGLIERENARLVQ